MGNLLRRIGIIIFLFAPSLVMAQLSLDYRKIFGAQQLLSVIYAFHAGNSFSGNNASGAS